MKNIVINMNSNYFVYSLAMLNSLFFNHAASEFTIYLLYSDMQKKELRDLDYFIRSHGSHFRAVRVEPERFAKLPMHQRWSVETYYRLLIAELLPDTVQKVLYLDVDVIIDGSIDALYETDIQGYYLAACRDIHERIDVRMLNLKWNRNIDIDYFNAGVMLLNLPLIRKNITFDSYMEALKKCQYELPYMDQDLLNYTMGERAYIFENDVFNHVAAPGDPMGSSIIYHYGTPDKPWKIKKDEPYYQMWWKYAAKSEYLNQGKN